MKSGMCLILYCVIATISITASDHTQLLKQAQSAIASNDYASAISAYTALLKDFPTHSGLMGNIGYAYKKLHNWHSAIEWYKKALTHDQYNARLQRGISHAYLMIGDFDNGWPAYEYRWVRPPHYNSELISFMHTGGNIRGKTIIIHSEYGLGDVLQFIRYAQLLKCMGATIIVQSHEPLIPLFELCPYIDRILLPNDVLPAHDFRILVMSLPLAFKTILNTIPNCIPYLYPKESLVHEWHKKIGTTDSYKIGVCWQANMHTGSNNSTVQSDARAKSLPIALLRPLADIPNVQLYSLQKNIAADTAASLNFPLTFFDNFDHTNGAFMDSAALMIQCNLVITVDTATAHLAGALGVKTWLLLPYDADWRWMKNIEYSPWYPTMQIFRQRKQGDWHSVIGEVVKELRSLF